jgi:hypothetical protein
LSDGAQIRAATAATRRALRAVNKNRNIDGRDKARPSPFDMNRIRADDDRAKWD